MRLVKKIVKAIITSVSVVFVLIQFARPTKNISTADQPNAVEKRYTIPREVQLILKSACYDCHSNNTRYPWYAAVQPTANATAGHVSGGKAKFNFDEFLRYPTSKQDQKLQAMTKVLEQDQMPLSSYILLHPDANLTVDQKRAVIAWIESVRGSLQ